ncbi:translation initiation factor IF-2 [Treponema sp.]|uniref:translation initiation factor IF-2 n=1 Tax=Treponema sp. TaxID=166 RepID=UPI00298DDAEF|nr:translation initiation factor IF-2 [Treponema sp.]MCR5613577.1 translation initiation factor IF-2 [Treponema sp.]
MAEETEKKPAVVLHKKSASAPAADAAKSAPKAANPTEKKKVVVVKKKVPSVEKKPVSQEAEKVSVKQPQNAASPAKDSEPKTDKKPFPAQRQNSQGQGQGPSQRPFKRAGTFEINSARPNVKAGNLSDHGQRSGYGNRDNRGGNGGYQRREGGFTGAQARQGYQNRERDGQNRDGRPGGFNRGGQGGFNRDGRPGGFNRGGQGGFNRGGQGSGFGGQGRSYAPPADNITTNKTAAKKKFTGKKQTYSRKDREEAFDEDKFFETKKKVETPASVVPSKIDIMETISVSDLARKMNLKASEIIAKLMSMGQMVTITQSIDSDTATLLAAEYNCEVHLVSLYDETVIESDTTGDENMVSRPPIVTVMGHVDHGKTKTLDAIRKSHVAEGEAGGITQAIGAYSVKTDKGSITFLDTPGHEAFTMMRARGAQITDIVVLVVAADDGVMPQTLEAINHAKDAKVPIIVAVNKVDKPEANPERVKTQLSELGLTPEEWGGDTQYVHISALKKEGIDDLLDAILLQAEMLELKSAWDCRAEGKILESRVDQGRGVVATVVVQKGTLHQGDPYVAGIYSGRVRAMFDDKGRRITEAGPSTPVEVLGMEEMPNAGDPFQVTESEKDARAISSKRQELKRFEAAKAVKKTTLESLYSDIADSEVKELKVIIKADLQGSAEALKASLEKLSTREIRLNVIHSSAGAINESDVTLASADENAIIIGFNVRPTPKAKALAEQEQVEIRKYNIIYKCVEEIQQAMEGMLSPDTKEEVIGQVEIRDTFKVPKIGVIAGCYVTEGLVKKTCTVNLIRDGIVVYNGKIASLKRFKDDAKEVQKGFECGIGLVDWQDIKVGDTLEVIDTVEVARKLGDSIAKEKAKEEAANGEDA